MCWCDCEGRPSRRLKSGLRRGVGVLTLGGSGGCGRILWSARQISVAANAASVSRIAAVSSIQPSSDVIAEYAVTLTAQNDEATEATEATEIPGDRRHLTDLGRGGAAADRGRARRALRGLSPLRAARGSQDRWSELLHPSDRGGAHGRRPVVWSRPAADHEMRRFDGRRSAQLPRGPGEVYRLHDSADSATTPAMLPRPLPLW